MLRESRIFQFERQAYQNVMQVGNIYLLGSFFPKSKAAINNDFIQMKPTENSILMFNTVRQNFNYPPFEQDYIRTPEKYVVTGLTSRLVIEELYGVRPIITNMTVELLDNLGVESGKDSIRLVELTENHDIYYYVMVGGRGALESKADELNNAKTAIHSKLPFEKRIDEQVIVYRDALTMSIISMVNDSFNRDWTLDDSYNEMKLAGVNTSCSITTPLDDFFIIPSSRDQIQYSDLIYQAFMKI